MRKGDVDVNSPTGAMLRTRRTAAGPPRTAVDRRTGAATTPRTAAPGTAAPTAPTVRANIAEMGIERKLPLKRSGEDLTLNFPQLANMSSKKRSAAAAAGGGGSGKRAAVRRDGGDGRTAADAAPSHDKTLAGGREWEAVDPQDRFAWMVAPVSPDVFHALHFETKVSV